MTATQPNKMSLWGNTMLKGVFSISLYHNGRGCVAAMKGLHFLKCVLFEWGTLFLWKIPS